MKNFSDLLATDLQLDLAISVTPIGCPDTEIWVNQNLMYQGQPSGTLDISTKLPLLSAFSISVRLKNKIYLSESETAIVLNKISIDKFDIVPAWTHLARYNNDHDICSPTSYMGFNGEWRLEITQPFYQWHHQVTGQGWLLHPVTDNLSMTL
jgi:hypothetical protein